MATKLAVVSSSPVRTYKDFDKWVRLVDELAVYAKRVVDTHSKLADYGDAYEEGNATAADKERGIDILLDAERLVAWPREVLQADVAKYQAGHKFYQREELYEEREDYTMWQLKRAAIAERLAVLVGSFPYAQPHNAEIYTRILVDEVHAAETDALILETACREWQRNESNVPSVAKLLKCIVDAQTAWHKRQLNNIDELLYWRDQLEQEIARVDTLIKTGGRHHE